MLKGLDVAQALRKAVGDKFDEAALPAELKKLTAESAVSIVRLADMIRLLRLLRDIFSNEAIDIQALITFPDWSNPSAAQAYLLNALNLLQAISQYTNTSVDDVVLNTTKKFVESELFIDIYDLISPYITNHDRTVMADFGDYAGAFPQILTIIQMVVLIANLIRELHFKQKANGPKPKDNVEPTV